MSGTCARAPLARPSPACTPRHPCHTSPAPPLPPPPDTCEPGKAAARAALRARLNLTGWEDRFIVAVVSRLTAQKGMHLIKHAAFKTIERGGQFVLLGSAPDPKIQVSTRQGD